MNEKIFISYSRKDKELVHQIVKEIEQETGIHCWIDLTGIESGSQFEERIIKAIDAAEIVVFMMSKNSIAPYCDQVTGKIEPDRDTWTKMELRYAIDGKKRLIPISIDGTRIADWNWLRFRCSGIDSIDYSVKEQKEKLMRNLIDWIGSDNRSLNDNSATYLNADKKKRNMWPLVVGTLVIVVFAVIGLWKGFGNKAATKVINGKEIKIDKNGNLIEFSESEVKNLISELSIATCNNDYTAIGNMFAEQVKRYHGIYDVDRCEVVNRYKNYDSKFEVSKKHSSIRWDTFKAEIVGKEIAVTYVEDYSIDRYDKSKYSKFVLEKHLLLNSDYQIVSIYDVEISKSK